VWECSSPSSSALECCRVNRMLIFTGDQGRESINELYPSRAAGIAARQPASFDGLKLTQTLTHMGLSPGYSSNSRRRVGAVGEPAWCGH
jgi:hypothetical protein